jgi:hypothetical protein
MFSMLSTGTAWLAIRNGKLYIAAGFTNQYRLDSGWQFGRGTDRDCRFEFREDVGGLTPFSFGRPWTGETVKNLCRPPGSSPSVGWRPWAGNTVFAVLMTIRTQQL